VKEAAEELTADDDISANLKEVLGLLGVEIAEADDDDEVEVMVMVGGEHVTSCHVHKDEIEYVNVDWRLRLK